MAFLARNRERFVTVGIIIFVLLAVATAWPRDLFFENQHDKFIRGLYLSGHEYLQDDWVVHTRGLHPAFVALIAGLDMLGILAVANIALEILLYLTLLASLWLLLLKLYDVIIANRVLRQTDIPRCEFAFVILGSYIIFQNRPGVMEFFITWLKLPIPARVLENSTFLWNIEGLAGQTIFADYFQTGDLVILGLLALVLMLYDKWRISALLLAIVSNFHFGYIVHFSIAVMTAAVWLYYRGRKRTALEITLIFGIANIPAFLLGPVWFALEPGAAETQHIIANYRIPHHSLPWVWWNTYQAQKLLFMIFGMLMMHYWKAPGVLRWIITAGMAVICGGIATVWITRNDGLALMHLWRSSVYIYPISQIIILAVVTSYTIKFLQRFNRQIWNSALTTFFVFLVLAVFVYARTVLIARTEPPAPPTEMEALTSIVQPNTTVHDIFIVPVDTKYGWDFTPFRLEVQRPLFVNRKSHPYYPIDFMEWWRRYNVVQEFYEDSQEERVAICEQEGVSYYILPVEELAPEDALIAATNDYQLVSCTP